MKINNPVFLTAKREKRLRYFSVVDRSEKNTEGNIERRTYMKLCVEEQHKYSTHSELADIETDTEIRIQNYSAYGNNPLRDIGGVSFIVDIPQDDSHIRTFLNAIRKDSDVRFKVVAFNGNDLCREKQLVAHQLYGIVDNKAYMLATYTGADNSASPVW